MLVTELGEISGKLANDHLPTDFFLPIDRSFFYSLVFFLFARYCRTFSMIVKFSFFVYRVFFRLTVRSYIVFFFRLTVRSFDFFFNFLFCSLVHLSVVRSP
ncbi:hypothetical protein C2G38_1064956 [Gigaspora rosea]|uniref:Uncharacterized protein n=1 Tax=Gigaspora rosea TaxID=44941 RepID=A0A397VIT2_9GLOM|nr:hypothetical protein C2G38_1064956 [Gigaspora rosea]